MAITLAVEDAESDAENSRFLGTYDFAVVPQCGDTICLPDHYAAVGMRCEVLRLEHRAAPKSTKAPRTLQGSNPTVYVLVRVLGPDMKS